MLNPSTTDLSTPDGILAEARRADQHYAPAQYAPLLRRCAIARHEGAVSPSLIAEVSDYASLLSGHGHTELAANLRAALPKAPTTH